MKPTPAGNSALWLEAKLKFGNLTPREQEVLTLVALGLSNNEIAAQLGCSPRTAQLHRLHAKPKIGAKTVGDMVRITIYAAFAESQSRD